MVYQKKNDALAVEQLQPAVNAFQTIGGGPATARSLKTDACWYLRVTAGTWSSGESMFGQMDPYSVKCSFYKCRRFLQGLQRGWVKGFLCTGAVCWMWVGVSRLAEFLGHVKAVLNPGNSMCAQQKAHTNSTSKQLTTHTRCYTHGVTARTRLSFTSGISTQRLNRWSALKRAAVSRPELVYP